MSADPANARLWSEAEVYIADLGATVPAGAGTPFGGTWDLVGLLDGETGFTQARSEEVADHFAWGGILMMTSRRNFKLTQTFVAFEHNDTTRRLRWPGSDPGEIVVPHPERILVAFETRDSEGDIHRLISAYQAEVTINGDITESEADPAALPFIATIYPDADGRLFTEQTAEGS